MLNENYTEVEGMVAGRDLVSSIDSQGFSQNRDGTVKLHHWCWSSTLEWSPSLRKTALCGTTIGYYPLTIHSNWWPAITYIIGWQLPTDLLSPTIVITYYLLVDIPNSNRLMSLMTSPQLLPVPCRSTDPQTFVLGAEIAGWWSVDQRDHAGWQWWDGYHYYEHRWT